jgi:ribosomal protein L19
MHIVGVLVQLVTHLTSEEVDTYRGVVLGIKRMGADTRFKLADVSTIHHGYYEGAYVM